MNPAVTKASRPVELPREVLLEAARESREKNFGLSRIVYALFFGREWSWAMLGYAYMKVLDNVVDEDEDVARARAALAEQRRILDAAYAGEMEPGGLASPERYGVLFCLHDAERGAGARPHFEAMLDTMEFDIERRGKVFSRAQIEAYFRDVGAATMRYLAHFVSPELELHDAFVHEASTAYLHADSMIDFEKDLHFGVINAPREDVEEFGIDLTPGAARSTAWMAARAPAILASFERAFAELRRVPSARFRMLARLYLGKKRSHLVKLLGKKGVVLSGA